MGDAHTYDSGVPARAIYRVGTTIAGDTEQNDACYSNFTALAHPVESVC